MFHALRKTVSIKSLALAQCLTMSVVTVFCLWLAIDLLQYAGSATPIVPGNDFDTISLGACCLLIISFFSSLNAWQKYDFIRTGG